jgi:hypothetical protein
VARKLSALLTSEGIDREKREKWIDDISGVLSGRLP